mmetsp:Transcript_10483/g.22610  ORF Transcript_10483/g.22610 Transcript_10483/m.22610 type:complete len:375 (+) Transcript_10483:191-1315(+)|eukprot:CAMPEP_0183721964 /NCGR_PEP_ID=MMETSP0737-20130205/14059_1 /TAXON_ID=385413 /ORGANISM="Thalassiosira miniscula, Strain CCMP1093" /LENGTH=374 /DNA_ID=CAMNT_0025952035 /DNA_START=57 /DNA_END=1181 /DNA_ORIENTATION=+
MTFLGLETFAQKGIFIFYITLWVSFGLLMQHIKSSGIEFNSATAVLFQCCFKILLSCYLYLRGGGSREEEQTQANNTTLFQTIQEHRQIFVLYMIPAALYSVYNILSYVNLRQFDPSTYFLLLNSRLVVTGLIRQVMFREKLFRHQWMALVIIMAGCVVKTAGDNNAARTASEEDDRGPPLPMYYGLLLIQILASQFANVYNELLLKKTNPPVPLHLQNFFLYINSILVLLLASALGITGQPLSEALQPDHLRVMLHPAIFAMVLLMSLAGVVAGAFLKLLDAVRKAVASAVELVVLPLLSAVLFGIPITGHLVCAVVLVSGGVYLYSMPKAKTMPAAAVAKSKTMLTTDDDNNEEDTVDVEREMLLAHRTPNV